MTDDPVVLTQGKLVFAENCAQCHSSKQPPASVAASRGDAVAWFGQEVMKPDFLEDNFLSTDARYPVTELETNSARALATNATRGNIWDNFSSETYKKLPSVGQIQAYNPIDPDKPYVFNAPGGGVGYYRCAVADRDLDVGPVLTQQRPGQIHGRPVRVGAHGGV